MAIHPLLDVPITCLSLHSLRALRASRLSGPLSSLLSGIECATRLVFLFLSPEMPYYLFISIFFLILSSFFLLTLSLSHAFFFPTGPDGYLQYACQVQEIVSSTRTGSRITSGAGFSDVFPRPRYQDEDVRKYLTTLEKSVPSSWFNPKVTFLSNSLKFVLPHPYPCFFCFFSSIFHFTDAFKGSMLW